MRVMLDTNVLVSMVLFQSASFRRMMEIIAEHHVLVLSSYVIDELFEVTDRKFPTRRYIIERFMRKLSYEMVYTPSQIDDDLFSIRDVKDYPVLYSAIIENVDIFVTGDKDFDDVDIEKPKIYTPAEFLREFDGNQ